MNYQKAEEILTKVCGEEGDTVDPEDAGEATTKGLQAVRDCLKMGLNGED